MSARVRFHSEVAEGIALSRWLELSPNLHEAESAAGYLSRVRRAANLLGLDRIADKLLAEVLIGWRRLEVARDRIASLEADLVQARAMIATDELTGCLNRRGLEAVLSREWARADRTGSAVSIAVLDVDNFKRLNDTYGHLAGDQALAHLAHALTVALRPTDVLARYGGEEFVVVLPHTAGVEAAKAVRRLKRELAARPLRLDDSALVITFSAGVAQREPGEAAQAAIARADRAVYRAKMAGKNRVLRAEAA